MAAQSFLDLPERTEKPRQKGLTVLIDNGVPGGRFHDVLESQRSLIDLVKFGWGTALVTPDLQRKLGVLKDCGVDFFFGGTLFEKALLQGRLDGLRAFMRSCGCTHIEVSNGSITLSNREKARYIREFAEEFTVLSEVGYKDVARSQELFPAQWIEYIAEDLEAGARWVITEARESGKSGICRADGELRYGLVAEILDSALPKDRLIFEAPNKELQVEFIRRIGPNANLANIALTDVIGLETLRLGLRSDTLMTFPNTPATAAPAVEAQPSSSRPRLGVV
ncbi:MAG: phosphosulfolactate synthase [Gemmatimonadota bacterium]